MDSGSKFTPWWLKDYGATMVLKAMILCILFSIWSSVLGKKLRTKWGTGVFEPWLLEVWKQPRPQALDLRVAKGLGSKGYGKVRISVVAPQFLEEIDFNFTYKQQFRYRWTENFLHSSLVDVKPGKNFFEIAGQTVQVDLPAENQGIRAVFWSDPCISSKWIECAFAEKFQTFPRSVAMLNAIYKDPNMDMFALLGDNFYDREGVLAKSFFDQLSPDVKRRFLLVVNGNHDNWMCGAPECGDVEDDFGIGQMQFYTGDPIASRKSDTDFLDFSINPDERKAWKSFQNQGSNFLVYHKLGNVGFLGFSGAVGFSEQEAHFQEACDYFDQTQPAVVFLLGHWNIGDTGCQTGMTVPEIRNELLSLTSCGALGNRLKYIDGHEHCNYVQANTTEPVGFMVGAHGMEDADKNCEAQYGFLYLDSSNGRVRLYYFEEASESTDHYEQLLSCVSKGGLSSCTNMAQLWLDVPAGNDLMSTNQMLPKWQNQNMLCTGSMCRFDDA